MGETIALMGGPRQAAAHQDGEPDRVSPGTLIGVVGVPALRAQGGWNQAAVIDVIARGGRLVVVFNNLWPAHREGRLNPGFFIKHFIKDMGIALDEARRMKSALPASRWCTSSTSRPGGRPRETSAPRAVPRCSRG